MQIRNARIIRHHHHRPSLNRDLWKCLDRVIDKNMFIQSFFAFPDYQWTCIFCSASDPNLLMLNASFSACAHPNFHRLSEFSGPTEKRLNIEHSRKRTNLVIPSLDYDFTTIQSRIKFGVYLFWNESQSNGPMLNDIMKCEMRATTLIEFSCVQLLFRHIIQSKAGRTRWISGRYIFIYRNFIWLGTTAMEYSVCGRFLCSEISAITEFFSMQ